MASRRCQSSLLQRGQIGANMGQIQVGCLRRGGIGQTSHYEVNRSILRKK
jgi:hypothetical protein